MYNHHILGIRSYKDKHGVEKETLRFFSEKWRVSSLDDLLLYPEKYLELVPIKERYNMFVTFAKCLEEQGCKLAEQNVIPFDIDGIDYDRMDLYVETAFEILKCSPQETGVIATGNGLHILVGIKLPILDETFFEKNRVYYKAICEKLSKALKEKNLPFKEVDPLVFAPGFKTRLPGTENIKWIEGKQVVRQVRVIRSILGYNDYDLAEVADMSPLPEEESISKMALKNSFDNDKRHYADSETVLSECLFMVYAQTNRLTERQWYNALNIAVHLPDGFKKCHDISKHDPRYKYDETQTKANQAYNRSGPMRCTTIEQTFDQCKNCPHYGKVSSPILLKGEEFVATEHTNFRFLTKEGSPGKVDLDGLYIHFKKQLKILSLSRGNFFKYNGIYWEPIEQESIAKWCYDTVKPRPRVHECEEFVKLVRINSMEKSDFFNSSTEGYMNFQNGVLKLGSWSLVPHDSKFGFTGVIPFDYDANATCQLWESTIKKVTEGNETYASILQEYLGYVLSGSPMYWHKALIMSGSGRNGKSTIIDTIKYVIGSNNYSSLPWSKVIDSEENHHMALKLANFSEEVGKKEFLNASSMMKQLIAGGDYQSRKKYADSVTIRNRTKFILACNELPITNDTTNGFVERLIILPFNAYITKDNDPDFDPFILDKLKAEASGILNWCIEGFKRLKQNNGFTQADETRDIINDYIHDNNPLLGFIDERVEFNPRLKDSSASLYQDYVMYCRETGTIGHRRTTFLRELEKYAKNNKKNIERKRGRIFGNENPTYYYDGISLISNLDKQADHF